jgi:hypothetical protein
VLRRAALESERSSAAFNAAFKNTIFERAFLRGAGNSCLVDPMAHIFGKNRRPYVFLAKTPKMGLEWTHSVFAAEGAPHAVPAQVPRQGQPIEERSVASFKASRLCMCTVFRSA